MANEQDDKLNSLLGPRGSIAERAKIAKELDDDRLHMGPERTSAGAAWSPPGVRRREAGTDHRTVVADHGDGNSRRIPLLTAVEGMPREARKREDACLRLLLSADYEDTCFSAW